MKKMIICLISFVLCLYSSNLLGAEQNLIGKIWESKSKSFINITELINEISQKNFILIGERHGRKAHQNREAFLLAALAEKEIYPDLYLEMITRDQSIIIHNYREVEPEYTGRLARSLDWANSHWPSWNYYQPIFNVALMAKLNIVGADLTKEEKVQVKKHDDYIEAYEQSVVTSWSASMKKAHCNLIKVNELFKITQLQIQRDKAMAKAISTARDNDQKAILIAGSAHVRNDRGIPRYLDKEDTLSIAMMEALPGQRLEDIIPASIDNETSTYDYVWFTPKIEKKTICDKLNLLKSSDQK